ncbi:uncharacterized protein K452DRAFT_6519 [Aplosporella prunicola CBS 121167]|uniref:Uncharacterized protein n=1 Tax=Aplosporella prunicola CBS 121167 TaxID=1176127 RepID=A0A6A6BXC4_9PEZI|nr:uncharacterized protein K452DRAFT_6519 [Aplosporella prunicola CBS 121167]KAF2147381.1 hypothetical protein K452DRAFT_6519 [Aplosporella prunicola CBS 121167]
MGRERGSCAAEPVQLSDGALPYLSTVVYGSRSMSAPDLIGPRSAPIPGTPKLS